MQTVTSTLFFDMHCPYFHTIQMQDLRGVYSMYADQNQGLVAQFR